LRPNSTAPMPAKHIMSHTMRCNWGCGSTPIHNAAHGRRRSAANQGGPSPSRWAWSCPSISALTASATRHSQQWCCTPGSGAPQATQGVPVCMR
jgi:hypothetical protein